MVSLFRQIIQQNPQLETLNMNSFSFIDVNENCAEIVFETLLNSNIDCIINLDLSNNPEWFTHHETKEERTSNVELLVEVITKQTCIQKLYLGKNGFSDSAFQKVLTGIAIHSGISSKLKTLSLEWSKFEADETVEKLADILQLASNLKKIDIAWQEDARRQVLVEIQYASEDAMGSIVLFDKATR